MWYWMRAWLASSLALCVVLAMRVTHSTARYITRVADEDNLLVSVKQQAPSDTV